MKEVEIWIARDKVNKEDCYDLFMYTRKPTVRRKIFYSVHSDVMAMRKDLFPEIKPGECRKAKIVLEVEK